MVEGIVSTETKPNIAPDLVKARAKTRSGLEDCTLHDSDQNKRA